MSISNDPEDPAYFGNGIASRLQPLSTERIHCDAKLSKPAAEDRCVYCDKPIIMQEVGYIHASREDGFNCPNKFPDNPAAPTDVPPQDNPEVWQMIQAEVMQRGICVSETAVRQLMPWLTELLELRRGAGTDQGGV